MTTIDPSHDSGPLKTIQVHDPELVNDVSAPFAMWVLFVAPNDSYPKITCNLTPS